MNRLFVAVAALSVFAFGCTAEGTEDPGPEPVAEEPQRDPPKQVRSGVFENPYDNIAVPVGSIKLLPDVPELQQPKIPSR
jgi:hypothetical protein